MGKPKSAPDWHREVETLVSCGMQATEAARKLGLSEQMVSKWAVRTKLLAKVELARMRPTPVQTPSKVDKPQSEPSTGLELAAHLDAIPVHSASEVLMQLSGDSKLKLAIGGNSAANHIATLSGAEIMEQSTNALQIGKLNALVHGWDAGGRAGPLVSLNFAGSPGACQLVKVMSTDGRQQSDPVSLSDAPIDTESA